MLVFSLGQRSVLIILATLPCEHFWRLRQLYPSCLVNFAPANHYIGKFLCFCLYFIVMGDDSRNKGKLNFSAVDFSAKLTNDHCPVVKAFGNMSSLCLPAVH